MNFAFLIRSKAVSSLKSWVYRLLAGHTASPAPLAYGVINRSVGPSALRPAAPVFPVRLQVRRPLRVVRVVESGQPRAHVGRIHKLDSKDDI